jgi:hypothetical protein
MGFMKYIIITIIGLYLSAYTIRTEPIKFPQIQSTTLSGQDVKLPDDVEGTITLVAVAFSQKAEKDLEAWFHPLFEVVMDNPFREVQVFFIPMLKGLNQNAAKQIENRMKKDIHSDWHEYIILYKGDTKDFISEAGITNTEIPYFFVLDKEGKITYVTSGPYNRKKLEDLDDALYGF